MSSGILCAGNCTTNSMVPLLQPSRSSSIPSSFSSVASFRSYFIRHKALVLLAPSSSTSILQKNGFKLRTKRHRIVASSDVVSPSVWDDWKPPKASATPTFSDILWPSAGAFAAMAVLGKLDQLLAPKGLSITLAPLGAVSSLLFATPSAPSARKYSMFMAQIGCAAIGVLAFTIFGPGWLAKCVSISACVAYMIYTNSVHPPAASLPLLFIDGAKFHHLNFWFALYPGAAGCILLCLMQEIVLYLKQNFKF